jgi:hypothetical protein
MEPSRQVSADLDIDTERPTIVVIQRNARTAAA